MEKSIPEQLLESLEEKKITDSSFLGVLYNLVRTQEISKEEFKELLYTYGRLHYTEGQNNSEGNNYGS